VQGEGRVVHHHRSGKPAASERVSILGEALATMDTEHLYLPPKVREMFGAKTGGCTQGIELTAVPLQPKEAVAVAGSASGSGAGSGNLLVAQGADLGCQHGIVF